LVVQNIKEDPGNMGSHNDCCWALDCCTGASFALKMSYLMET